MADFWRNRPEREISAAEVIDGPPMKRRGSSERNFSARTRVTVFMDGNELNYLFAVWMVGGVQTIFDSLKDFIGQQAGLQALWLPIEMEPRDWITMIPPISFFGLWKNSMATWLRARSIARQSGKPNAAYFLEHSIVPLHWSFTHRIPYVLAMDHTPLFCARHKLWYAVPEFDPSTMVSWLKQRYVARLYRGAFHLLPFSTA